MSTLILIPLFLGFCTVVAIVTHAAYTEHMREVDRHNRKLHERAKRTMRLFHDTFSSEWSWPKR